MCRLAGHAPQGTSRQVVHRNLLGAAPRSDTCQMTRWQRLSFQDRARRCVYPGERATAWLAYPDVFNAGDKDTVLQQPEQLLVQQQARKASPAAPPSARCAWRPAGPG